MLSRSRKAFTLLELIVVIVILGILAALAIPTFAAVIERSRNSTAVSAAESFGREAVAIAAFDEDKDGSSDVLWANVVDAKEDADKVTLVSTALQAAANGTNFVQVEVNDTDVYVTFDGNVASASTTAPTVTP